MEGHPFRFLRNLGRTREIATVLLNHGFGDIVTRLHLGRYLQWGRRVLLRQRGAPEPLLTRAQRIRLALESLGPTFIKFGQVASTRADLIPADVIHELSRLQENVPPFSADLAIAAVENELGAPLEKLFASFDHEPLAAGSLAQVHRATLPDGSHVAVKIRRPSVTRDVERDLSLMQDLALLATRHIPEAEIFDPVGLVSHFARTIRRELNFAREGRTIDEFARLFRNDATLYVPHVDWERTSEAVLTMEYVEGCRITDPEGLAKAGIAPHDVARNGVRIFMKQAFVYGLFHGDPHPGNIRILSDGSVCLLDFGMIGMLDERIREQLVDLFVAITRSDVSAAVDVVQVLGHPSGPIDESLLRIDIRDFVECYYGFSLERLKVGAMLTDFVSILSNHRIRLPGDLMLLVRAFVTLEGAGRELDPEFNLAEEMAPFIGHLLRERYGPRQMAGRAYRESRRLLKSVYEVPVYLGNTLEKLSRDELKVQLEHRGLDHLITELDRSSNRIVIALVMSALIVASALIIRTGFQPLWISAPIFVASSLLGLWLIYGVFRSGRL